jgi:hypothetical protein
VPGKDVNRSAVSVVVERELNHRFPLFGDHAPHHHIHHGRVLFVDQPIELDAASTRSERQVDPDRGGYSAGRPYAQRRDVTAFQQGH